MSQNKRIEVKHLGLTDYQEAVAIQESHHQAIVDQKKKQLSSNGQMRCVNYLLFCEHPPVYTLGKSASMDHLLVDLTTLQAQSIALYHTNRGGAITYHGPGQLVVYPIIDLENFFTDIHRYLRLLEEAVIETLHYFTISATRFPGLTGIWLKADQAKGVPDRKICAIGIRVSRWVTMHGLALNVNNTLTPFYQIVPCGIPKPVTSMQKELNQSLPIGEVAAILQKTILKKLSYA